MPPIREAAVRGAYLVPWNQLYHTPRPTDTAVFTRGGRLEGNWEARVYRNLFGEPHPDKRKHLPTFEVDWETLTCPWRYGTVGICLNEHGLPQWPGENSWMTVPLWLRGPRDRGVLFGGFPFGFNLFYATTLQVTPPLPLKFGAPGYEVVRHWILSVRLSRSAARPDEAGFSPNAPTFQVPRAYPTSARMLTLEATLYSAIFGRKADPRAASVRDFPGRALDIERRERRGKPAFIFSPKPPRAVRDACVLRGFVPEFEHKHLRALYADSETTRPLYVSGNSSNVYRWGYHSPDSAPARVTLTGEDPDRALSRGLPWLLMEPPRYTLPDTRCCEVDFKIRYLDFPGSIRTTLPADLQEHFSEEMLRLEVGRLLDVGNRAGEYAEMCLSDEDTAGRLEAALYWVSRAHHFRSPSC